MEQQILAMEDTGSVYVHGRSFLLVPGLNNRNCDLTLQSPCTFRIDVQIGAQLAEFVSIQYMETMASRHRIEKELSWTC